MEKTWSITYYEDGKPANTRHGFSHRDAVTELYLLSRGAAPAQNVEEIRPPAETGELQLAAA
ncbi:MAG: hypothetical protein JSS97_02320 [Actinobacteria bacterium]|nr:hypothetical protein [Actinomycetota bacterium]